MQQPELEPVITIDPDTRVVTVPKELYNIAVVGDHNAETVYITVPRFFDGIDFIYIPAEVLTFRRNDML